jgi:hypothetical protein
LRHSQEQHQRDSQKGKNHQDAFHRYALKERHDGPGQSLALVPLLRNPGNPELCTPGSRVGSHLVVRGLERPLVDDQQTALRSS